MNELGEQLGRAHAEGGAELVREAEKRAKAGAAACARKVSPWALAVTRPPIVHCLARNKAFLFQFEQGSCRGERKGFSSRHVQQRAMMACRMRCCESCGSECSS
jgi:hypothetical protein